MKEPRNHGTTEGQGESSIAPLFQSGAIINEKFRFKSQKLVIYLAHKCQNNIY